MTASGPRRTAGEAETLKPARKICSTPESGSGLLLRLASSRTDLRSLTRNALLKVSRPRLAARIRLLRRKMMTHEATEYNQRQHNQLYDQAGVTDQTPYRHIVNGCGFHISLLEGRRRLHAALRVRPAPNQPARTQATVNCPRRAASSCSRLTCWLKHRLVRRFQPLLTPRRSYSASSRRAGCCAAPPPMFTGTGSGSRPTSGDQRAHGARSRSVRARSMYLRLT